ncbi:Trypsin inhibitor [Quillaja saponaria]|uniref:Trypsin inhibitor n=1 Tax=Quillaja saponaria TaxID=32244 RepID=A0AAD7M5M9_QUISA|nr:Trypsin inhibitor [Quillaja saponaria]
MAMMNKLVVMKVAILLFLVGIIVQVDAAASELSQTNNEHKTKPGQRERERSEGMAMMNKLVVMKVAILLFLVGIIVQVDAAASELSQTNNEYKSGNGKACCDLCVCTKSIPPQCRCTDRKDSCHSACKSCICTRSYPPICQCRDVNDFCYKPCIQQMI